MINVCIQASSSKLLLVSAILLLSSGGHGFLIPVQALVLKERNPLDKVFRGLPRPIEIRRDKVRNVGQLMIRDHELKISRLIFRKIKFKEWFLDDGCFLKFFLTL